MSAADPLPVRRILITGSRNWTDWDEVAYALMDATPRPYDYRYIIVHGGARGADTIAAAWAKSWGMEVEVHPADWRTHGKAAGPIRNQKMVDLGAHVCLAFPQPKSVGTWDCVRRAKAAGIPVTITEERSS